MTREERLFYAIGGVEDRLLEDCEELFSRPVTVRRKKWPLLPRLAFALHWRRGFCCVFISPFGWRMIWRELLRMKRQAVLAAVPVLEAALIMRGTVQ